MSQKMKLSFSLSQKLAMTTQLQQSIETLAFSHQELKEKIEEELLNNPLLESVEREDSLKLYNRSLDNKTSSFSSVTYEKQSDNNFLDNVFYEAETLKNHLMWQVQMKPISEEEKSILALLTSHLDDQGYLRTPLESLSQKEKISLNQLEFQLQILQEMEPAGVGARSFKECLLIQARYLQEDTKDMVDLIQNHLHLLELKDYSQIASLMNITKEEVEDLCSIISTMEPYPARRFSSSPTAYVVPDVYIRKDNGDYKITLQEDSLPHLQISSSYKKWLEKSSADKEVKKYMKEKVTHGNWFIKTLLQRQETIRKVCYSIISHQMEFFEKGPCFLKPLILKDVAEDLGIHRSTVSRATSRKYAHTPHGLVPLKYFFNTGLKNEQGEIVSVEIVKNKIKSLIDKEDALKPLSDQNLSRRIYEELKLSLSRRTIAQYRDSLGILSFNKRNKAS